MSYEKIENFYLIRLKEDDEEFRAGRFGELEELLRSDERAEIRHVITPISAITAFVYEPQLVDELKERGYELTPQEKNFRMID